jgi:hypothetical protein
MRRLIVWAVCLSISLAGFAGAATAQDQSATDISTDANGSSVKSTSGINPVANAAGSTIVYGDIDTGGAGRTVLAPPTVIQNTAPPPPDVVPEPAPAPAEDSGDDTVATGDATSPDSAVASDADLDADNEPDALEPDLGLDPANPDSDGDGVADGDELNIYGTDPLNWDTDGDGVSDGDELFDTHTDPLVWDDFSAESTDSSEDAAAQSFRAPTDSAADGSVPLAQEDTEHLTATEGGVSALGTGNASAAPGTVTRGGKGTSVLGPDGTYNVVEVAPPSISVSGDTGVLAPAPEAAPEPVAETTAPVVADTDGDGVADEDELNIYGTDPSLWDTDGDGLADGEELFVTDTDPLTWDTDGDGVSDGDEVAQGSDPLTAAAAVTTDGAAPSPEGSTTATDETALVASGVDGDNDRLTDADEAAFGTDPTNPDTDGDGYYDGDEVNLSTDPLDPASHP